MNQKDPLMNKLSIVCPHFSFCSGCVLAEKIDSPPVFAEAIQFFKTINYSLSPLRTGHPTGWRSRAKLAVRGSPFHPLIGLYQEGTHTVLDIPFCQVHHPKLNEAVQHIKEFIRSEKILPYDETTHQGCLRYLQLVVERATQKVQSTFVLNEPLENLNKLIEAAPEFWHSLWINPNQRRDNVIFEKEWQLFHGERFLWEKIGGNWIAFHPSSFAQANLDLFEELITSLRQHIPKQTHLVEYYAGVGAIGLALAPDCASVIASEIHPLAESCFNETKTRLDPQIATKCSFVTGDARKLLSLLEKGESILVDPPRKGLDRALLEALKKQQNKTLIYISCGWESFQRDCTELLVAGWVIEHAEAFLLFPGSNHIEVVAVFQKNS